MTRLKVLSRSATFAWSPKQLHSRSLAAGTTAQQFDASFSSAAVIDLCPLDDLTADGRLDLNPSVSANVEQRFHKIVWSSFGGAADQSNGLIIGGCDNGVISFYNPQLFGKDKSAKVHESRSHSGHVMALDVNPFQPKLICSGAANSELFIWDLHQPTQPMSPGPKQQPFDQVVSVQWNRKVEHILGTLNAEKALIWDLRKADGPILSMGDLGGRTQWRHLSWHPEEATSLCISSEDDNYPVVQKWDVRFATTPVQHMQFHQRGIVAMDWCPADPDLLVTGGKDHKLFLVNPNTGQFLAEIPYASRNWPHQVSWCDWNPNLIGCASLDGRVTIYSLVGGAESGNASSQQASPAVVPKLADSFPGADFSTFNQTAVAASAAAPIAKPEDTVKLPNVPRWLRPGACGARFGFGGRLVTFGLNKSPDGNAAPSFTVDVKQVVADDKLMNRAMQLQDALDSGQMGDFCEQRAGEAVEEPQQLLWTFLSAQSQGCSRKEYLKILGIDHEKERAHFTEALGQSYTESVEASNLPETANSSEHEDETHSEPAVGPPTPLLLPMDDGSQAGLLMRALIVGDFEAALEVCVNEHQWADAAQISISGGNKLYQKFLKLYEREMQSQQKATSRLIAYLSGDRWNDLIDSWELRDWKRLVCVMLSLAPSNRIRALCTRLVNRMLGAPTDVYSPYAAILSVVGANVDLLVASLDRHPSTDNVQKIVEQTMALRWIVGGGSARAAASGPQFARLLAKLAQQLVAQGCLDVAWRLLDSVDETTLDDEFVTLKDRLYWACGGQSRTQRTAPKCPFAVEKIGGVAPAAAAAGPGYLRQPQQRDARSWSQSSQVSDYPAAPSHQLHSSPPIAPPQQHVGYVQPRTGLGQDHMSSQMNAPPPVALPNNSMSPGVRGRYPSASNADQILHAAQSMSINQTGYSQSPAYATGMYNGQQPMAPVQPPAMPQTFMPDSNRISSGGPPPASAGYPAAYPDANRGSGPPVAAVAPRPAPVVRQCAPGWNDPPPMEPRKSEPKKAEIPPPVTFGVVGAHAPNAHPPQFGQPQSHHLNGNGYAAPNQMQHNGFGQQAGHSPSSAAQHQHQQQQQQHQPPPEPEPAPIPAEHAVILQTLQHLAQLCASINATPLVRKRTEDASHKIDSELGGRLRQQRLTTSTLENLHHLVRYVQHSDYQSALALHTQMVQGYDFAEISPFMPSLKALLQSGVQLGVRYQ